MSKYIVKNCDLFHPIDEECMDSSQNEFYCKDRTKCLIKQVIDKCKEYKKIYGSPISNMRFFAIEILDMFDIEEVKE